MSSTPVERDQFEISDNGITHKPTGASFSPYPGDPRAGNLNLGRLGEKLATGEDYRPNEVRRMMERSWAEYVDANPSLFKFQGR